MRLAKLSCAAWAGLLMLFMMHLGAGAVWAQADLTMVLSSSVENSATGTSLVFSALLTNTSSTDPIYLNDIQATFSGPSPSGAALHSNSYFSNVPGILMPGETYNGEVFRVAMASAAANGDYSGTVTLIGGSDVFGTTTLASANFTVLTPQVTLVASTPTAEEYGPVSGVFTITRTGGTEIALPVNLQISGTATNGSDYNAISSPVIIPAGASSATVNITPILLNTTVGQRSVTLGVVGASTYDLATQISDTVVIQDTPANSWRLTYFGAEANTLAASDTGNWSGDGIPNLIKYALNLNPLVSETNALPTPVVSGGYLTLTYVPNPAAIDVTFSVVGSTDLAHWGTANVQQAVIANPNPPGSVTYYYTTPVGSGGDAFLKLEVTH